MKRLFSITRKNRRRDADFVFAVKAGGGLARRVRLPSVVGELLSGIIVGPYALGSIALPGLPGGLFPLSGGFAVSPELYGFSTIASIVRAKVVAEDEQGA